MAPHSGRFTYRKIDSARNSIAVMYDGFCVARLAPHAGGWVWQSNNPTLDGLSPNKPIPALQVAFPEVCGWTIYADHIAAREAVKVFVRETRASKKKRTCAFCGTMVIMFCPFCNHVLPYDATSLYAEHCELVDRDLADLEQVLAEHERNHAQQIGDRTPVMTIQQVYECLCPVIAAFLAVPATDHHVRDYNEGLHQVRTLLATLRNAMPAHQAQQAANPKDYQFAFALSPVFVALSDSIRAVNSAARR